MIKDIIAGHISELFNHQEELAQERLAVCEQCPLYTKSPLGMICNKDLTLNPRTNEVRYDDAPGFFRGCNCRMNAKTRRPDAFCPAGKW